MDPRAHVDALKTAADPGMVAAALGLRERGRRYFCPACQTDRSRTPDLVVSRKGFHCFKCGQHGDLLGLVELAGRMDFAGAVAWLENLTGIRPEGRARGRGRRTRDAHPSVRGPRPAEIAAKVPDRPPPDSTAVFAAFLEACRPVEGRALAWLQAKGVAPAVVTSLGLRFCGREYAEIMTALQARFGDAALLAAGMLKKSSRTARLVLSFWSFYARKIGVIVIPYLRAGAPVYLKVRPPLSKTEAERLRVPRFLNAGGAIPALYNVDALAAEPRPDRVLICEGESDTWAALSAGYAAVGSPGASGFKPAWVELFRPFVDAAGRSRVFLVPDNDERGAAGARTIAKMFLAAGLPLPLQIAIPAGKDLCEYLTAGRKEGRTV